MKVTVKNDAIVTHRDINYYGGQSLDVSPKELEGIKNKVIVHEKKVKKQVTKEDA